MRGTRTGLMAGLAAIVVCGMCAAFAAQPKEPDAPKPPDSNIEAAKRRLLTSPEALAMLKADEGVWDVAMTIWARPGAAPKQTTAVMTAKMSIGGMFLEQVIEGGPLASAPESKGWTSVSYTGHNATTGDFEAVRMASTHSTMIPVRGSRQADGTVEMRGEYMFVGMKWTARDVIRHEGPDKYVVESWMSFGEVKEWKGTEMVMTRRK